MPLVLMNRKENLVNDHLAKHLAEELTHIVSMVLNTPEEEGGELVPDDIEVRVRNSSDLDVNAKPLEIIIWANDFPKRRANLGFRQKAIVEAVKGLIPSTVTGFVWILLLPASFGEF